MKEEVVWYQFDGDDYCENCNGWDGSDSRCDCGNRRVTWECLEEKCKCQKLESSVMVISTSLRLKLDFKMVVVLGVILFD